jgi:hypothetical protein
MNKLSSQKINEINYDISTIRDAQHNKETEIFINERISFSPSSQLDLFADEQGQLFKKSEKISSSSFENPFESFADSQFSSSERRKINREISKKIPIETINLLRKEYTLLVKNKFNEGITTKEEKRLLYLRWQLDRIDDAEFGEDIDRLEFFTENVERFASDVGKLIDEIKYSTRKTRNYKR